jgi:Uncharacterized protein with conserved CXXC pairs
MMVVTCIVCPNGCRITVNLDNGKYIVSGNLCLRGKNFALNEVTNPTRSVCSTIKTIYGDVPRVPVRTSGEVPLGLIFNVMRNINSVVLDHKVHTGEIIISDVCGTGVDVISTSDMYEN